MGHINARFDDCRADQDIGSTLDEIGDDFFEAFFAHFAMCDRNPGAWQQFAELGCFLLDAAGVIEQIENLALARQFAQDGFGHDRFVVFHDIGLDRAAFVRRLLEDTDVADAGHRHVQRARDWCG